MNLLELKKEIVDLGFEEDSVMTDSEYKHKFVTAINRAIDYINTTVRPYVKSITVEGEEMYDMAVLAPDFVDFYGRPKITINGVRKPLVNFVVEGKTKLFTNGNTGQIDIYYKAYPTRITETTADDFEIELDKLVLPLIAPLASYFVWLDDDERKATMYYNIYDSKLQEILANSGMPSPVTFTGGVIWHR